MVGDISHAILNQGWRDEGEFRFSPSGVESTGTAKCAQEFLRLLKGYVDPHLQHREKRDGHYEDFYAAATQIVQDEICEIVDPMLRDSAATIQAASRPLYEDQDANGYPNAFAKLAHSATLLIHWGVYHLLYPVTKPIGLGVLNAAANAVEQMEVFTVNHDVLVERQLQQGGIPFTDGFSDRVGDVLRFNWSWKEDTTVRLYKLHGSLDWYRFGFPGGIVQFAKVPMGCDPSTCKDGEGEELALLNQTPLFLTGTTGKERLYGVGFVGEFFIQFHSRLADYHTLICCGYGWADKGINNRVNQWLLNAPENRIVILHNNALDELKHKQFWSKRDRWTQFQQAGKIVVVPKWLSDCALNDLEPFFDN